MTSDTGGSRIGVLIVAYNAASTLASVLDRLPPTFRSRVAHVLICDDASDDDTYTVGLGHQAVADIPITVVRHQESLGYGGNQKTGDRWALDDRRGIFDSGHLRFFTRRGFERLVARAGFDISRPAVVGLPIEALERGQRRRSGVSRLVQDVDRTATRIRPTMFGYQFLYELQPG